ncbi:MAG TPA: protein kinase [Ktedonobacterales bacterium]|nr:protein kinase [Ktedonobacterales bacterium]
MELEVLGDRYELQEPIGRGGMATIYRAVDLRMGRTVAVKILREVYSTDPKFVTRFQREARAASALQHPNIVQVFDYGQSGESYFIVMEYVEGADLRRYLKKRGILENERAVEIAHDVALGLGAAHKRGIVHRDVKPQNVMLNDDGLVKLTDFGIASMYKDAEAERLTTTGMTLGTVQYYAPEQAQGEIVSPAADIYALGIVMYEMLCGRTPFDGDTPVAVAMRHIQDTPDPPSTYNPRITPGLERIILRCLEKDPRARYRDGDALAYALENYARSGGRRPTGTVGPTSRPQFAPLGLPSTDGRPHLGAGPSAYGSPAVASGPRVGSRVQSQPVDPRPSGTFGGAYGGGSFGGYPDAPTYEGFDGPGSGSTTSPFGPAGRTIPRSPTPGHPSGPWGPPEKPDEYGKRGNGSITALIVGAAVLLLGLTCFLVLTLTSATSGLGSLFGGGPPPTATVALATVPDFTNETFAQAQITANKVHLQVTENDVASTAQQKGLVISQNPLANQQEPWGTYITLNVGSGPANVTIPDVSNQSLTDAENTLIQLGLKINKIVLQSDPTVPSGDVIKSDPKAGTSVAPGSKVTLYVSSGQPTPVPTATPVPTTAPVPTPPTP